MLLVVGEVRLSFLLSVLFPEEAETGLDLFQLVNLFFRIHPLRNLEHLETQHIPGQELVIGLDLVLQVATDLVSPSLGDVLDAIVLSDFVLADIN